MNADITVDVDYVESVPAKTALKLIETRQTAQKNLKAFAEVIRARPALFRRLEELDVDVTFNSSNDYLYISFTGGADRLGEVWGEMRRSGYKADSRPQKGETTAYVFWRHDGLAPIFMHFTSSVCKRVKVGTKTVEQDVYEIQCGELPVLEMDAKSVVVAEEMPF